MIATLGYGGDFGVRGEKNVGIVIWGEGRKSGVVGGNLG